MGSVGPFELAPAPDLERLMPLLPSLFFSRVANFAGVAWFVQEETTDLLL